MQIFQESTCVRVFINKVAGPQNCNFIKETPTQIVSCEIWEIFKNTFFYRTSPVAAFDRLRFPACNVITKETPAKIFFREFYKTFLFTELLRMTASCVYLWILRSFSGTNMLILTCNFANNNSSLKDIVR